MKIKDVSGNMLVVCHIPGLIIVDSRQVLDGSGTRMRFTRHVLTAEMARDMSAALLAAAATLEGAK